MERLLRVVLLSLSLGFSSFAYGSPGPTVPDDTLTEVPAAVRDGWRQQEEVIAQLDRELDIARSTLSLAASLDTVDAARRDLRAALTVASNLEIEARSTLEAVRLERIEARIRLDRTKLDQRLAGNAVQLAHRYPVRSEIRETRAHRRDARDQRREARAVVVAVTEAAVWTERTARDQLAVAEDAKQSAQNALNDMGAFSTHRPRITAGDIVLLEARRDLAFAELEHDRAVAAVASGSRLVLAPFEDALDEARAAEGEARQALVRPTSVRAAIR